MLFYRYGFSSFLWKSLISVIIGLVCLAYVYMSIYELGDDGSSIAFNADVLTVKFWSNNFIKLLCSIVFPLIYFIFNVKKCLHDKEFWYVSLLFVVSIAISYIMSKRKNAIPQVVVIESVERYFVNRLSNIQFDSLLELDSIYYEPKTKNYIEKAQDFYKKKLGMVDDWENPVKNVKLTKDLFSCKDKERDLYFYHEDLFECSDSEINDAVENLKLLHDYAMTQGIYMIYMVAADKYDVYQKYIVDNPYKPNDILSKGNRFDSLPYFINTKYVLTEAAENGVKDIYWADDSHWSPIGAKIVAEEIARRVDSLELF